MNRSESLAPHHKHATLPAIRAHQRAQLYGFEALRLIRVALADSEEIGTARLRPIREAARIAASEAERCLREAIGFEREL
jgi:hypothetical protein